MSASANTTSIASPRIIALINQKGGVGKTTTTVNLGSVLSQAGKKVCLIDLDPQAHLTLHLGVDDDQIDCTMYDLLVDPQCTAEQAVVHARDNLDAILAEVDLAGAEPELASVDDRQRILKHKFAEIADRYDYVLIDCPPSLGLLTLNALALAKEVVVPMQAHFLALQGVGKLLETVGLVCQQVNPELRVTGVVLCMHESQTTLAKEVLADLDGFFESAREQDVPWRDCVVLRPPVRRNIKLAEAPSFGQTILEYEPGCPGARDYVRLAESLVRIGAQREVTAPKSAGHHESVAHERQAVENPAIKCESAKPQAAQVEPKPMEAPVTAEQQRGGDQISRAAEAANRPAGVDAAERNTAADAHIEK